ncbi:MAG: hypothetical protein ABSA47_12105, partial [Verrucomicrobiota bacterium]
MKRTLVALCGLLIAGCVQNTGSKPLASHPAVGSPAATPVTLEDFKLVGNLASDQADFTLTATAVVEDRRGGSLDLCYGTVALTSFDTPPYEHIRADQNHFVLDFDRRGKFPVKVRFSALVSQTNGWDAVDFHVAQSVIQPVVLQGLAPETQFHRFGAARPERIGSDFISDLLGGYVNYMWKEARPETEGRLFYSAEMLSQINVLPGLMRQSALLNLKVMQGEMNRVTVLLRGAGEVTSVRGAQGVDTVLGWNVEPVENSTDRRLVVQLNQPQKDQFSLLVLAQTPLGAFPQTVDALQLRPEEATRFAGYFRIVNEGAVRLEVAQARGASQIAPEQFPESDTTRAVFRTGGNQRFVFRFAGEDFALRIQADQILPEMAVSERLAYRHGENETVIDAEFELDIREAPLRELTLRIPKGYTPTRVEFSGMSDYVLSEPAGETNARLRLVYGQPVYGRQLVQLRLERNKAVAGAHWTLPQLQVEKAKSVRGFVGVSTDPGYRITPEPGQTAGLTEIATAFFPGRLEGIQAAFRLTDTAADSPWEATLLVEALPQTVQVDALHLFSIGEGIAYGSSLFNYVVSGAPMGTFKVELSDEYENVEFTGKDIRNWQKTNGGFVVQLHTPVAGAFTLLATYDRPFKAQGETLLFTGARPLDAQTEQGYTLVISAYQFQVRPTDVSPSLLELEPAEVPPEYRLFFDAPILKAYRYGSRPFDLKLALSPLAQGDSVSQIVDRASYQTRITKEGQVLTTARYFIKNRGNPNFRLTMPPGTEPLWSASINGQPAVLVTDGPAILVPLPQSADPNAVQELDLTLAAKTHDPNPEIVTVAAPISAAPVMLAEWRMAPDPGRRLVYQSGSLKPADAAVDVSGFAQLTRLWQGPEGNEARTFFFAALALVAVALGVWRWVARSGACKYDPTHLCSLLLGLIALGLVVGCAAQLAHLAASVRGSAPADLTFLAPVQRSGSDLHITVSNVPDKISSAAALERGWPALAALALWVCGWIVGKPAQKIAASVAGWTLLAWAALRFPNGAPAFFWVLAAFLVFGVLVPALLQLSRLPRKPAVAPGVAPSGGAAPATLALLAAGLYWMSGAHGAALGGELPPKTTNAPAPGIAESVTQTIRVEESRALGTAKIRWQALKGQTLPVMSQWAVLTHIAYPTRSLKLETGPAGSLISQQVEALENGVFEIEENYQTGVSPDSAGHGFRLPVPYGLINRVTFTVVNLDVDVSSPQAVSIQCDHSTTNTVAALVLSPVQPWINWGPRSRDVKREKPAFYAKITQLFVPSGGVVEGAHLVTITPAQGQLDELTFNVPTNATVTDVIDPAQPPNAAAAPAPAWRFDPDTRKLRVTLNPALWRPFALLIRSQVATGPLPFDQTLGLVTVDNAAGQVVGVAGIATSDEVQLDSVKSPGFSAINLEDFPMDAASAFRGQLARLTLRRAFSYTDTTNSLSLTASAVEPEVWVDTRDTLSLGEDHTTLADSFTADIARAGIFNLSFLMPEGFDVDSISGAALSQWTESKTNGGRVITLHLNGKTQGRQEFAITLAGPGVKTNQGWQVPQVAVREANKQQGTLLIVPEQGMGLQALTHEGYTQLDPLKSGIRQKGVLAFSLLQGGSNNLTLDIEQVDPWIEVTSLQHAAVHESQLKITANLLYQIKNAGLKGFRVLLPTNAEHVVFQGGQALNSLPMTNWPDSPPSARGGGQVLDSLPMTNTITNGLQEWEVKLDRRVIGQYLLQVTFQSPIPAQASETTLWGVQAAEVNLQRGFVTVQSDPRLQVTSRRLPPALQLTEWQSIPRVLEKDLASVSASLTYRLLEPAFLLPLKLERHEATRLLPAHVNNISFNSVISDDGVTLTQARLEILPGDKPLLNVTLPANANFWFAFVNDNGVWPWRGQTNYLIPLEQQSHGDKPVSVEIFYESTNR